GDTHDIRHRDIALIRTTEHCGNIATHTHAIGLGLFQHRHEALDGFVDGGIDVFAVERFTGGREYGNFVDADTTRPFVTTQIRHQYRVINARLSIDPLNYLRCIRHLRNPVRLDEAGGLYGLQASQGQPVNQIDFGLCRHNGSLILQAVARPDFDYAYVVIGGVLLRHETFLLPFRPRQLSADRGRCTGNRCPGLALR